MSVYDPNDADGTGDGGNGGDDETNENDDDDAGIDNDAEDAWGEIYDERLFLECFQGFFCF